MAARKIRPIRVEGQLAYVPLTQGYEAVIDAADVPLVQGHNWQALVRRRRDGSIWTVYATTSVNSADGKCTILMHRTISGTPDGFETDHEDGNGLNNRSDNLRTATVSQNRQNARISASNTSGVKGVCWDRRTNKWKAQIAAFGERHERRFSKIEDAADWYAQTSAKLHGEFGRTA